VSAPRTAAPLRLAVVITAGGTGRRMGAGAPKQFLTLAGRPVLARTLEQALEWGRRAAPALELAALVVSHPAGGGAETARLAVAACQAADCATWAPDLQLRCLDGGATRQESVRLALAGLPDDLTAVFVHDGARPLASAELYQSLWQLLERTPAALGVVPLLPPGDTLKAISCAADGLAQVTATVDREGVRAVQTPQLFRWPDLRRWHERAAAEGFVGTDDASLAERYAPEGRVLAAEGRRVNLKLTRPEDLAMAEGYLRGEAGPPGSSLADLRVGQGFDVHAFTEGRPLILGGVEIPHERGLAGHSDADVLLHAISDALLGAAGLDDIGAHFPDTDSAWKGADSWKLLVEVNRRVRAAGFRPLNVDATLICERPKIRPYVPAMRARIAAALELPEAAVNVKGTTTERLGFTGRGEGIAAQAVCLLCGP